MGFFSAVKGFFRCGSAPKQRRSSSLVSQKGSANSSKPPVQQLGQQKEKEPSVNVIDRRRLELIKMQELDKQSTSKAFSFVSSDWLRHWVEFANEGANAPGPISNRSLYIEGKLKAGLVESKDFIILYLTQYDYLLGVYGGDLPLTSLERDIYSATIKGKPPLPRGPSRRLPGLKQSDSVARDSSYSLAYKRGSLGRRQSAERVMVTSKLEGGRETPDKLGQCKATSPIKLFSSTAEESTASSLNDARMTSKRRHAAGFYNPNNYCFMNAALQCLFSISPFADYFLAKSFRQDAITPTRFSDALAVVAENYFNGSGVVKPEGLWRLCNSRFPGGRQHDLPEFMRYILEELENELRKQKVSDLTWENYERYYNQMLVKTFGGQTVQDVTCKRCNHVSKSYEIFTDIALELSPSVENSLRDYTAAEHINTDYRCESCKKITNIIKQTRFLHLPNYLILQIKRFESGPHPRKSNYLMRFNNTMVVEADGETVRYQLVAVAVHSGSLGGGHYIAYGRREGNWYMFNDENCSMVPPTQVMESQAYLLIYMK